MGRHARLAYKGKIALEKKPNDMLANAGKATGADKPFAMTDAEIGRARDYLVEFKPNILKLAPGGHRGATRLLGRRGDHQHDPRHRRPHQGSRRTRGEGRVAKEGTVGFTDAEMIVRVEERGLIERFIEAEFQPQYIAKRFLTNAHPLFNEKAYKMLVDQGHSELPIGCSTTSPSRRSTRARSAEGPAGNERRTPMRSTKCSVRSRLGEYGGLRRPPYCSAGASASRSG